MAVKSDKCNKDRIECFENELISYVDNLENRKTLGDFIVLEKDKEIPKQNNSTENIIDRCVRYLKEHALKLNIVDTRVGRSISGSYSIIL